MIQRKKWGRFSNGCTKDLGSSHGGVKEESRGGGGDMNTKSTHVQRQRVQPSIKIITVMAKKTRNKMRPDRVLYTREQGATTWNNSLQKGCNDLVKPIKAA